MTELEMLEMEPGRKLDGLVAKEIMGIEVEYPFAEGYPYYLVEDPHKKGKKVWDIVALYSGDISAALRVVEKLGGAWDIKRRFRPHPDDPPMAGGRPTYQATVFLSEYDEVEDELFNIPQDTGFEQFRNLGTGRSPWAWSLPEAICKAALLAKYSDKNN